MGGEGGEGLQAEAAADAVNGGVELLALYPALPLKQRKLVQVARIIKRLPPTRQSSTDF